MKFTAKRLFALLLALLLTVSSFAFAEEEPVVTVEAVDETYDSIEAEFGADEDAGFTADIAVPVEEAIAPVEEVIAPAEDDAAPAEDAAPVEDEAVPAEDADKPAEDAAPVEDADKPAEDADKPAEDAAAPAEDADKPAEDDAAPEEDDAAPEEEVEEAEEVEVIFEDSGEVVTAEAADGYVGDSFEGDEPVETKDIYVQITNPNYGKVTVTAGGNTTEHNEYGSYHDSVPLGSTVVVEAFPNEGCSVVTNSFYCTKEDNNPIYPEDNPNTLTFMMDDTIDSVHVRFAPPARTVIARINAGGQGTITIMGNGEPKASTSEHDEISYSAAEDEEITIIAQPDEEFFEYTLLPGAFEVRKGDINGNETNETYPEFEPNADGTATLHVTPSADDTTYVDVSFAFKKVHVGLTDSADSSRYKTFNSVDHASMFKSEKGRWYFRFPENPFDDTLAKGTAPVYSNAGYTYQVGDCVALQNNNHYYVEVKTTIPVEVDASVEHGTFEVASPVARGSQFRIVAVPEKGYHIDSDGITVTCGDVSLEVEERDYNQFWCAVPEDPTGEKIVVSGTFTQMSPDITINNYEYSVKPNFEVSAIIGGVPQDLVAYTTGNYTSYGYYVDPGEEVVITVTPKQEDIILNPKRTRAYYGIWDEATHQSIETVLATAKANGDGSYTLSFTKGMFGCSINIEEYRPNITLSYYDPNYVEVNATIDGKDAEMLDREGERGFYAEEGAKVVITLTAKNGASFDLSETSVNQYRSNAGGTVSLLPNGPVGNSQSCTLEFTQPSTEDYDNVWVNTSYVFTDSGVNVYMDGDSDEPRGEISVTVNGGEPVTMNGGNRMFVKANDGDKVTVKATPKEGYTLLPGAFNYLGDKYDGEKDGNSRTYTFTMEKEFDDGYRSVSVRFASSDVPTVTLGAEDAEDKTYRQDEATGEALFKAENGMWVFTFPSDYNPLGDEVPEGQKLVFVDDDDAENEPYDGDHAYAPGSTVEMEGIKRFHAEYRKTYDIAILPATGGTATVNMDKVAPGETIRVTLKPDSGYSPDGVNVWPDYPGDEYDYYTDWVGYNDADRSEQYTVHVNRIPEDAARMMVKPYFCKEWEESAPALPPATVAPAPAPAPAPAGPAITIAKAPAGVKAKAKKAKVTVSWKKIKKNKAGKALLKQIQKIEIQVSTDPTFATNVTTKTVSKKKTKVNFSLQKKTTYFVRVRYVGADGVSNWSAVRKVKTKK